MGGDRAAFEQLDFCYKLLMNDDRRARYDATGEIDDAKAINVLTEIMAVLVPILNQGLQACVAAGGKPECEDWVMVMTSQLDKQGGACTSQLVSLNKQKSAYLKVMGRFTEDDGKHDSPFNAAITSLLAPVEEGLKQVREHIERLNRCRAFLKKTKFKRDIMETLQSLSVGASATAGVRVWHFNPRSG